jgi:predicted Rossmann fold flavoprotein
LLAISNALAYRKRMNRYDVIIIGAGAAGLMAAGLAGQRGRSVLLLEHTDTIGAKILISGGGRCNFTNLEIKPERFLSKNPHFAKSALAQYTQNDFIALVERYKIDYYEKTLGQLFCVGQGAAKQIVAMLVNEAKSAGVEIKTAARVQNISKQDQFVVVTDDGSYQAESIVLATGGLSIPKIGATDFTYRIAERFGLPVVAPRPGLVPLTAQGDELEFMASLAGVSFEASASLGKHAFQEGMLFTHKGLSGPAVLQISSYWREGDDVTLDLLPGQDAAQKLLQAKASRPNLALKSALAEHLPARFVERLTNEEFGRRPLARCKDKELLALAGDLKQFRVKPSGTEGYAKAEVTLGGVDTEALSQKTMESKTVKGLFVVGEAVDVTGWLGGYNFQWAWSSGWCAGMSA